MATPLGPVRSCLLAVLAAGTAAMGGCAATKPWEREHLAKPVMAPDPDADEAALRNHLLHVREGAVGGFGSGGGGCGCN